MKCSVVSYHQIGQMLRLFFIFGQPKILVHFFFLLLTFVPHWFVCFFLPEAKNRHFFQNINCWCTHSKRPMPICPSQEREKVRYAKIHRKRSNLSVCFRFYVENPCELFFVFFLLIFLCCCFCCLLLVRVPACNERETLHQTKNKPFIYIRLAHGKSR